MLKKLLAVALACFSATAMAVDYENAKITAVSVVAEDNFIRFTIDKDPNAIFFTRNYTGEQHNRVIALIMAAYTAQSNIRFIRSSETTSANTRHYTDLVILNAGTGYTFD